MGISSLFSLRIVVLVSLSLWPLASFGQEEKSLSMSFIKTAEPEVEKETSRGKVKARVHVVRKGEYLWKIIRKEGFLKRPDAAAQYDLIRDLNREINDLNVLRPGDRIFLPVTDATASGNDTAKRSAPVEKFVKKDLSKAREPEDSYKKVKVKRGQTLLGIIGARYKIPASRLYGEYIPRLKALNPRIKDIDHLIPGQILRLPVYLVQEKARASSETQPEASAQPALPNAGETQSAHEVPSGLVNSLGEVFSAMGEEWINTGKHFIPLQGGGQVDFDCALFPVLSSCTGVTVIVDIYNKLPPRIAKLVEASWGNYRVVHLGPVALAPALGRILAAGGYQKVLQAGEPFKIKAGLDIAVRADFTVVYTPGARTDGIRAVAIRLRSPETAEVPPKFSEYLESTGIRVVDIPKKASGDDASAGQEAVAIKILAGDPFNLAGEVLSMAGNRFASKEVIPMSRGRKGEFSFSITADYLVHLKGREAIIDMSGIGSDMTKLLEEKGYSVISVEGEKDRTAVIKKVLDFVGISFKEGMHFFTVLPGGEERNFVIEIDGIVFTDARGNAVLATKAEVPFQVALMLERKGVRVAVISSMN